MLQNLENNKISVLFDLDGTFADTSLDLCYVLNTLLKKNNKPLVDESKIKYHISRGAEGLINYGFGSNLSGKDKIKLNQCKLLLERIEAYLRSNKYYTLTINMTGENPDQIASIILNESESQGLKGPTISKVYNSNSSDLYAVTMIITKDSLIETVSLMRKIGAQTISVHKPDYLFDSESDAIKSLLEKSET